MRAGENRSKVSSCSVGQPTKFQLSATKSAVVGGLAFSGKHPLCNCRKMVVPFWTAVDQFLSLAEEEFEGKDREATRVILKMTRRNDTTEEQEVDTLTISMLKRANSWIPKH